MTVTITKNLTDEDFAIMVGEELADKCGVEGCDAKADCLRIHTCCGWDILNCTLHATRVKEFIAAARGTILCEPCKAVMSPATLKFIPLNN